MAGTLAPDSNNDDCDFKDFEVDVDQGGDVKYVIRVGLKKKKNEGTWLKKGLATCVSKTNKMVRNVKPSTSDSASNEIASPLSRQPGGSNVININWNGVVDYLIKLAVTEIVRNNSAEIPLPDFEQMIDHEGFISYKRNFSMKNGKLRDLTTLRRTGDTSAVQHGASIRLTCYLGLEVFNLNYDQYDTKMMKIGPSGNVSIKIGSDSIKGVVTLGIGKGGECTIKLNELKVVELSGVKVKLTGFGLFNGLVSKVVTWQIEKRKDYIVDTIELNMTEHIRTLLTDVRCDDYIMLFKK